MRHSIFGKSGHRTLAGIERFEATVRYNVALKSERGYIEQLRGDCNRPAKTRPDGYLNQPGTRRKTNDFDQSRSTSRP